MTVPPEAVDAAANAVPFVNRDAVRRALEAAAPLIAVPVPVLEALASAWEAQADRLNESAARAADRGALPERTESMAANAKCLGDCARMLREAITHGGQG